MDIVYYLVDQIYDGVVPGTRACHAAEGHPDRDALIRCIAMHNRNAGPGMTADLRIHAEDRETGLWRLDAAADMASSLM